MTEKLQLAERLIKEGNLTLEEAMILMDKKDTDVGNAPIYVPWPVYPNYPQYPQWHQQPIITCGSSTSVIDFETLRKASPEFTYTQN